MLIDVGTYCGTYNGGREMGGLVELDRAQGILAEHAVDDTDVEVEVSVER